MINIVYLPVEELKPYEGNAKKHRETDINAIAASIKRFGFRDPIGIWGGNASSWRVTEGSWQPRGSESKSCPAFGLII